jgi:hypothetical protein
MGGRSPHCPIARRACRIQHHLSAGRKLALEMVASDASNVRRQAHHRTNHHPLVASAGKIRIHQPGSASFVLLRYRHVPEAPLIWKPVLCYLALSWCSDFGTMWLLS